MDYTSQSTLPKQFVNPHANGRVDIMNPPQNQFELFKNPGVNYNEKTTSYTTALSGNISESVLSKVFFHHKNIDIIQNGIRAGVYQRSNGELLVGRQNEDTVKVIMRSIYLQNARNDPKKDITTQVEELNKLVLDYCVPNVYNETIAYKNYLRDVSTLPMPNDRPEVVSTKYDSIEFKSFF